MAKILITRPEPEGSIFKAALQNAGYDAIHIPILRRVYTGIVGPLPDEFDALLLTSASVISALGKEWLSIPVFAVGTATATAARHAGFQVAEVGTQTGAEMIEKLSSKRVAFPSAEAVAPTTLAAIQSSTAKVIHWPVYRMETDPQAIAWLRSCDPFDAIPLFSPSAVAALNEIKPRPAGALIAVGTTTANAIEAVGWTIAGIAEKPTSSSVISAIHAVLASGTTGA